MKMTARSSTLRQPAAETFHPANGERDQLAYDDRYVVRLARDSTEVAAALRLRHEIFTEEFGAGPKNDSNLEFDAFDFRSEHLIAVERANGRVIGTYRINSVTRHEDIASLYSHQEFLIEDLPAVVIERGAEIGRACVAKDHRNSKALLLLWKALARYLTANDKGYVFGCCSIFSDVPADGSAAYRMLRARGAMHPEIRVFPRRNAIDLRETSASVALPHLFEMYLRLGAKVCGPPMYDAEFGSADFFVLFDLAEMNERYRRIFF